MTPATTTTPPPPLKVMVKGSEQETSEDWDDLIEFVLEARARERRRRSEYRQAA
jgi:hypothetical protein